MRIAAYGARRAEGGREGVAAAAASYAELAQVLAAKEEAARDGLFEEAALLRSRELELKGKLTGEAEDAGVVVPVVTSAHIEAVVSAWTGIPLERMSADETGRLLSLASVLKVRGGWRGGWGVWQG